MRPVRAGRWAKSYIGPVRACPTSLLSGPSAFALAVGLMLPGAQAATSDGPALKSSLAAVELRKQTQALKSENDSLRRSNEELSRRVAELSQANAELKQRVESGARGRAEEQAELDQAKVDLERGAGELQTARRQFADSREANRKAVDELEKHLAAAEQSQAQLRAERDAARQERPAWAALAAVLAAGLAAAGVRRWWPRRFAKPCSVSVAVGAWSSAVHGIAVDAAFSLRTQWLPGDSSVHALGGLVRHTAEVVTIHGEAA